MLKLLNRQPAILFILSVWAVLTCLGVQDLRYTHCKGNIKYLIYPNINAKKRGIVIKPPLLAL